MLESRKMTGDGGPWVSGIGGAMASGLCNGAAFRPLSLLGGTARAVRPESAGRLGGLGTGAGAGAHWIKTGGRGACGVSGELCGVARFSCFRSGDAMKLRDGDCCKRGGIGSRYCRVS